MTRERCGLCGEPIDPGDADAVQVHGGEGGLVYEGCLAQYDDADDPPQDARPTGAQRERGPKEAALTTAELWAERIRDTRDPYEFSDILDWLHSSRSETHVIIRDFREGWCLHVFRDRSVLDCSGYLFTREQAAAVAGAAIMAALMYAGSR